MAIFETVTYSFPLTVTEVVTSLVVTPVSPLSNMGAVQPIAGIVFTVTGGGVGINSICTVNINGVLAVADDVALSGFSVTKTPASGGARYAVLSYAPFAYGSTVYVEVFARYEDATDAAAWSFRIMEDPTCFVGPLNSWEERLLLPFTLGSDKLKNTELLRQRLLFTAVNYPNAAAAIRALYLRGFSSELAVVFYDIVPAPTTAEKSVRICHKNTILQQDELLAADLSLIPKCIDELFALGLPQGHRDMFYTYLLEFDPNAYVPMACLLIFLAKALEDGVSS